MAADSRINIVLDVDTKNTEAIEATAARLTALGRSQRALSNETNRLSGRMDQLNGRLTNSSNAMNRLNQANLMFIKHARKMMYLVIGLGIEFLAVTAALVSVNAAFAIGNAAMKVYNWGMQGLAGAVAAAGAAALTAAAAFQEFNAAAYAFRFKESPALGSAISQSADALRMLQVNSTLASYGITALNQAYAAFSKNAKLDPQAVKQLQMMSDFGTGPNRDKSMAAAAEYISLIRKNKGFTSETTQLASQIGPEFEKAAKKYSDSRKLLADLESGALARAAGVEGFGNTVNQTLVAQLKSYLTKAFVELADAGKYLLEPVKKTFNAIFNGLMRAFRMVRGDLINFGRGGLLGALETLSEKTEAFAIKLFREFLPAAAGWWKRTGDFFKRFVNDFKDARDSLDSMREGGSIVIKMFGEPLVQIFKRIGQGARQFADLAKNNKEDFLQFGEALKRVVDGFFDIGAAVRKAFTAALPVINKVVTAIGILLTGISKIVELFSMMGPIGGTMAVAGMTRYALKGRRSERYERRMAGAMASAMNQQVRSNSPNFSAASWSRIGGSMTNAAGATAVNAPTATINAGQVIVNGRISGGGRGPSGGPAPAAPIVGNVGPGGAGSRPVTRFGAMRQNIANFMFGPSPQGQGAIGANSKNRFTGFLTGFATRSNAFNIQQTNQLLGHLAAQNPGANLGQLLDIAEKQGVPIDPDMAQRSWNKGKPMGKMKALGKSLKMKSSVMGGGMLASIGTGMFLESSMGQKMFSDPNAQNWMQTGAMLMPFSPLLGLGVGLGGAALNAKTLAGGIGAGIASGAAIGGMIGPWGAAVGALIGAAAGGIASVHNKNKMAKAGATAVTDSKLMEITVATLASGIISGTSQGGRQAVKDFNNFVNNFEKMNKSDRASALKGFVDAGVIDSRTAELMSGQGGYGKQAVGRFKKEARDIQAAVTPMFDQFDESMRGLQLATGLTSGEIMKLAAEMNVNLYDPTVKLTDIIGKLGVGMKETAEQINTALRDIAIKSTSVFEQFTETEQMRDSLQAAQARILGGDTSTEAFIDYYNKAMEFQQLAGPGAGISGFLSRYKRMQGGEIYTTDLPGVARNPEFDKLLKAQLSSEQTGITDQFVKNIGQALVEKNVGFANTAGGQKLLQDTVGSLITRATAGDTEARNQLFVLEKALAEGTLFSATDTSTAAIGQKLAKALGLTGDAIPKAGFSVGGQLLNTIQTGEMTQDMINALSEGAREIYNQMTQAFSDGLGMMTDNPEWWNNPPPWWNTSPGGVGGGIPIGTIDKINGRQVVRQNGSQGVGWYEVGSNKFVAGDTSTSRALRASMGAHSRFNGMLPGKRMITSSWREWGLGSPSSDHATGRAYDLVGDNLQQYAKNITDAGGFAEFHGVNGQRHLHVVPPIGPIGDTSTPASMSKGGSTTYGGDSFNITVVESRDARVTADEVVQRILEIQKNTRRRM